MRKLGALAILGFFSTAAAWCQPPAPTPQNVPIYHVTVVERTVKAVDYQYRSGPTMVDFRGTVLLPKVKGNATVESKAGHTEVDVRLDRLEPPTRFGGEYLTYVLWAITPDGHAKNMGELISDGGDHAKTRVTTDLQAFGMIVTAEPYSAVRQPSDVVVAENEVRPDTVGHIEQVSARYELLPRGQYTYTVPSGFSASHPAATLPFDRYEEILEVYQAQNAVQIARAAGADRLAADTFAKAEQQLSDAQQFQVRRADRGTVVTAARLAAQTAEDARMIALKHKQDEEVAQVRDQAARERELRLKAEADAQRAMAQSSADRMQLSEERAAREQAERELAAAKAQPAALPALDQPIGVPAQPAPASYPTAAPNNSKVETRMRLAQEFSSAFPCRDTPRGLVMTLPDYDFRGGVVTPSLYGNVARIASIVAAHPGLIVEVDGHTDSTGSASRDERISYERAESVRDSLIRAGVPANSVIARGLGGSHPLVSNASASGREKNRRVEITISGEPLGTVASWDRTYSVVPR